MTCPDTYVQIIYPTKSTDTEHQTEYVPRGLRAEVSLTELPSPCWRPHTHFFCYCLFPGLNSILKGLTSIVKPFIFRFYSS